MRCPESGTVSSVAVNSGDVVEVGAEIMTLETGEVDPIDVYVNTITFCLPLSQLNPPSLLLS